MKARVRSVVENGSLLFQQNSKITQFSKSGRVEEACKLFNEMTHRNTVTFNSMISAYAKNRRINDALNLFDKMPRRNLVSWNTMISGCLHNERVEKARQLLDQMPQRDIFTWTLMITCYTRNGELEKARNLFNSMPDKMNPACWNAMISGYVNHRKLKEARQMFDEMPVKDLVSWNSMLGGYTQTGEMSLALNFFDQIPVKDVVSWNLIVDGFSQIGDCNSAWRFFKNIPNPNIVSWVTILSALGKNGQIKDARKLLDEMPVKNIVSWNAMIATYVQNSQINEALTLFNQMPEKNAVSWTTMINGYVRNGHLDQARQLLDKMPYKNTGAQTAMISGYTQNKRINEAREIFNQIHNRDTVCWNTMIVGYVQNGIMDEALDLFEKMPKKDVVSWNTMIAGYCQDNQMDKALDFFKKTQHKNIVTWNSLISGFTHNGYYTNAFEYFKSMIQNGYKPDESTYALILSSSANLAALHLGTQIHQLCLKNGYEQDIFVTNSLITMYAKSGHMSRAKRVFYDRPRTDVISWNSLIDGYALNGYGIDAVAAMAAMEVAGVIPDEVTFIGVLSACSHGGLIEEGFRVFESMVEKHSIDPLPEHYGCMVDLVGRAGRPETALQIVEEMKTGGGNAGVWGALLDGCRVNGDLKVAEDVAEKLTEIEPEKGSGLVMLSNVNAAAGRWEVVERVRGKLKERKGVKQPGCSWIEVGNRVRVFVSGGGMEGENNIRVDRIDLAQHEGLHGTHREHCLTSHSTMKVRSLLSIFWFVFYGDERDDKDNRFRDAAGRKRKSDVMLM
ncbi:hypothetical protein LXL04_016896 [Taraxacum kok-saghyz]